MITQEQFIDVVERAMRATPHPGVTDAALEVHIAGLREAYQAVNVGPLDSFVSQALFNAANAFAAQGWDAGYGAAIGGVTTNPFSQTIAPNPA